MSSVLFTSLECSIKILITVLHVEDIYWQYFILFSLKMQVNILNDFYHKGKRLLAIFIRQSGFLGEQDRVKRDNLEVCL